MPKNAAHTEVYKGFRLVLNHDSDPQNPRDDDNLGKMICFHGRHSLGDKHDFKRPRDVIMELTGKDEDDLGSNPNDDLGDGSECRIVWEPLYLYDHSGITMKTSPFSCPWDSGQVGLIYVTYDDLAKEHGFALEGPDGKKWVPTPEQITAAETNLKAEVSTYDSYIRGDVYGYQIYAPDEEANGDSEDPTFTEDDDDFWCDDEEESCWGFFGYDYALQSAKEAIDAIVDKG